MFCEEAHVLIIYAFVCVVPRALDGRLPMVLLLVMVKKHDYRRCTVKNLPVFFSCFGHFDIFLYLAKESK